MLSAILRRSAIRTSPIFPVSAIHCETVKVTMRDGVQLATELYLPPTSSAPAIAVRTPYGRGMDMDAGVFLSLARRGYVVVAQDCRGTGDSEPDSWDYYMYEPEDGYDLVEWVTQQVWFNGFLGSCGGSYIGQTQWHMALHPRMSTIVPEVSGLGVAVNTVHLHMFVNAYARSVGKGDKKASGLHLELEEQMLQHTLTSGYFNEPLCRPLPEELLKRFPHLQSVSHRHAQRWLWEHYCSLSCAERAKFIREAVGVKSVNILDVERLSSIFGQSISHDRHTLPHPRLEELCQSFHAPIMLRTGWYDWALNDTLATWELLISAAPESMRSNCRLVITPSAHNVPGYHEGMSDHPELQHAHGINSNLELLIHWFSAVREHDLGAWPVVIYYLMGANEWCAADSWPVRQARSVPLYLDGKGRLSQQVPAENSEPDRYTYDPQHPTPTIGGSIVSYVYPPGSVDASSLQKRSDVVTYTTQPLEHDVDVVGPLRLILYASSSAVDTDFAARLSDVFPDGRSIQLQNGILRTRYRQLDRDAELLEPGRIYRLEIDLWATANRFKLGHSIRLDISSADFPRFDRNSNRGGIPGAPLLATQAVYHDSEHPSQLLLPVIGRLSIRTKLPSDFEKN